jgi:hypothetical protein
LRAYGPRLVVLVFALGNEWLDMNRDRLVEDWEKDAALHDLWNTMLAPTLLLLVVRFAPSLTSRGSSPPPRRFRVTAGACPGS